MVVKCDNVGVQMKTHDILDKDERTVAKAGGMPINLKVYANSQGGMTKEASRFWLDESVFSHCPVVDQEALQSATHNFSHTHPFQLIFGRNESPIRGARGRTSADDARAPASPQEPAN